MGIMGRAKSSMQSSLTMSKGKGGMQTLLDNNKAWVSKVTAAEPNYFTKLGSYHKPEVMWLGCAETRENANEIIGTDAGEVFTHRNIGNCVVNTDSNLLSGLQYAVDVLEVDHIVVCGHYRCGAVRSFLENADYASPLENWLCSIREAYRLHRSEIDAETDKFERQKRLVEFNVMEQCRSLYQLAIVQRRLVESGNSGEQPYATPRIHACIYDEKTGTLKRMNWNAASLDGEPGIKVMSDEANPEFDYLSKGVNAAPPQAPVPAGQMMMPPMPPPMPQQMPMPQYAQQGYYQMPPPGYYQMPPPGYAPAPAPYMPQPWQMPPGFYPPMPQYPAMPPQQR